MRICKVIFWQFQDNGDQNEKFARDVPHIAVEGANLFPIFGNDLVLTDVFPGGDVFVNVELHNYQLDFPPLEGKCRLLRSYHFNVLFYTRIANPPLILAVPKILAFGEVAETSASPQGIL